MFLLPWCFLGHFDGSLTMAIVAHDSKSDIRGRFRGRSNIGKKFWRYGLDLREETREENGQSLSGGWREMQEDGTEEESRDGEGLEGRTRGRWRA